MRREVWRQMRTQVRRQNVNSKGGGSPEAANRAALVAAGSRLLQTYAGLSERGVHLFGDLLGGQMPKQWSHYPEDDAIDLVSGFQWFYHSHSPEDRPGAVEHGHIHLFARRKLWARRLRSVREMEFAKLKGETAQAENTRHLLTIGFNAKGVPATMATVNSWVTGDRMLSASLTAELLSGLYIDTGYAAVDAVIESLVAMYQGEIHELLDQRDKALFEWRGSNVLSDRRLEVLSEIRIDVDKKLQRAA
jgi:hypothetical protein